jgi:hypothetical protein
MEIEPLQQQNIENNLDIQNTHNQNGKTNWKESDRAETIREARNNINKPPLLTTHRVGSPKRCLTKGNNAQLLLLPWDRKSLNMSFQL